MKKLLYILFFFIPLISNGAVTSTLITSSSTIITGSSFLTATSTFTANQLYLACFTSRANVSAENVTVSATSTGMTWTVASSSYWDTDSTSRKKSVILWSVPTSTVASKVTFTTVGQNQEQEHWVISEFSNTATTSPIGLINTNKDETATHSTSSVTMGQYQASTSATYGCFGTETDTVGGTTAGNGFTTIVGRNSADGAISTFTEWRADNATTTNFSANPSTLGKSGVVAIEILSAIINTSLTPIIMSTSTDQMVGYFFTFSTFLLEFIFIIIVASFVYWWSKKTT